MDLISEAPFLTARWYQIPESSNTSAQPAEKRIKNGDGSMYHATVAPAPDSAAPKKQYTELAWALRAPCRSRICRACLSAASESPQAGEHTRCGGSPGCTQSRQMPL